MITHDRLVALAIHVSSAAHWACKGWSRAADFKPMLPATEADLPDLAAFNAIPGLSGE
jgi:hypothetical protein